MKFSDKFLLFTSAVYGGFTTALVGPVYTLDGFSIWFAGGVLAFSAWFCGSENEKENKSGLPDTDVRA